jgi:hypothetical protein
MANYSSPLKSWGATGAEFPDGYSYVEGEQPVDEWDNFVNSNLIADVVDHLIPLTNDRIESDKGAAGSEPGSPESAHLYYDEDNNYLEYYDSGDAVWQIVASSDDTLTVTADDGLNGGGSFSPTGGSVSLSIEPLDFTADGLKVVGSDDVAVEPADFAGAGLEDDGADNLRIDTTVAGDGLDGGSGSALSIDPSDFAGSGLEEDGANNLRIDATAAGDGLDGGAGAALSIDPSDFAGTYLYEDGSNNLAVNDSQIDAGNLAGNNGTSGQFLRTNGTDAEWAEVPAIASDVITIWSGSISNIPPGWVLCDGNNGTPNLQERFVVGAGAQYSVGDTGGSAYHALSVSELPSHNHSYTKPTASAEYDEVGDTFPDVDGSTGDNTGNTGGDSTHENRPPFYALAYIMKV